MPGKSNKEWSRKASILRKEDMAFRPLDHGKLTVATISNGAGLDLNTVNLTSRSCVGSPKLTPSLKLHQQFNDKDGFFHVHRIRTRPVLHVTEYRTLLGAHLDMTSVSTVGGN